VTLWYMFLAVSTLLSMNNDNPRQKYEVKQEVYAIKPRRPEDIISKADLKEKKVVMV